uniref:Uncharacterized protein n=1 Tax=Meloidogyne incognita TaxID=6306 RepID=A0A914MK03_MELIC
MPNTRSYAARKRLMEMESERLASNSNSPTTSRPSKFKKRKRYKYHIEENPKIIEAQQKLKEIKPDEILLPSINNIELNLNKQQNLNSSLSQENIAKQICISTNKKQVLYRQPSFQQKCFFPNNQPRPLNSQLFQPPPLSNCQNMHGNNSNNSGRPPMKRPHLMHQPRHHLQHQQQHRGVGQVQHRLPHPKQIPPGPSIPQQQPQQQIPPGNKQAIFPQCANDVLVHVGDFVKQHGQFPNKSWNRVKIKELQNLLDQDLFCLSTDLRSSRLNPLQNFKLLGIVCNYFDKEVSKEADPKLRYLHFDIIFCGREGEPLLHEARVQFLIKICSLAAQFPVYGLFDHVGQWLGKVTSDELKRSYADQIVSELVEGFIFGPEKYNLYEHLLPIVNYSFEFCANFIVFAISKETLGPVMALIIGEWLCHRVDQFLRYLSFCTHLSLPFCGQKFDLLVRYVCSPVASKENDDNHYRLHYILIKIITAWRYGFTPTQQQKRPQLPTPNNSQQTFQQPIVNCLPEIFQSIDSLSIIAQSRILELIVNSARANFFSSMEPFRNKISSLNSGEFFTNHGTLWHSLEVLARARKGEN